VIVGDKAQISEHITNLSLVKKALATRDRIGNSQVAQGLLGHTRLLIAAIQNRKVTPFGTALEAVRRNAQRNGFGLDQVGVHGGYLYGFAKPQVGPQLLVEQVRVVADDLVGGRQNALNGTIVLLELDQLELRVIGRELGQVFNGC